ncbi:MAG: carboxypeptidase M32, partial [Bacteroidota bacterium]
SHHFWKAHYPTLQTHFKTQLSATSLSNFYKGINKVEASYIRTESDELHYHFHILIRYELEKALLEGNLQVAELESVWNEKYKTYLDLDVHDANQGILQDVHWSYGSIGYFPTYSLGSFYAAQFFQQAQKDIPELDTQIQSGDTSALLHWLQTHIYQYGRLYSATELCKRITGEALNFDYFYNYAVEKYSGIYGL